MVKTTEEIKNEITRYFPKYKTWNYKKDITIEKNGTVSSKGRIYLRHYCPNNIMPIQFRKVDKSFFCKDAMLKTLWGSPVFVGLSFTCSKNQLKNLQYCPRYVGGFFSCTLNPLETLRWFPEHVGGYIKLSHNPNLEYLQLLKVHGCADIIVYEQGARKTVLEEILRKYIGKGFTYWSRLQHELIKAGYGQNARFPGGVV